MEARSSKSIATFINAFTLPGYAEELPPGDYEVIAEEELLQGVSFLVYRTTALFFTVQRRVRDAVETQMITISPQDLRRALSRDQAITNKPRNTGTLIPPVEDVL